MHLEVLVFCALIQMVQKACSCAIYYPHSLLYCPLFIAVRLCRCCIQVSECCTVTFNYSNFTTIR